MKNIFFLIITYFLCYNSFAQKSKIIKGIVIDSQTKKAQHNAEVWCDSESDNRKSTGTNGGFILKLSKRRDYIKLICEMEGYEKWEIWVTNPHDSSHTIQLIPKPKNISSHDSPRQISVQKAHITSVTLTDIPTHDAKGLLWDMWPTISYPDVYIKVYIRLGNVKRLIVDTENSYKYEDADLSNNDFRFPILLHDISDHQYEYIIEFWDDDKSYPDNHIKTIIINSDSFKSGTIKQEFEIEGAIIQFEWR